MKWLFLLPLVACIGLYGAVWLIHRPGKRLEQFCANIAIGESQDVVRERARTAGFKFLDSHKPQEVLLIFADNFPGVTICQLTLKEHHVDRREFFID